MEATDDALQPRAQLSMLPDELKTHIARLCAEQDDAIREALVDIKERYIRLQHLSWRQLCTERFRYEYAVRFGRFFVSLDLTPGKSIGGYLHLAGAVLLLPNLVQIKVGHHEHVFVSARDTERSSHSKYAIDSAEAAVDRLLKTVVDVSMTDTDLDQLSERMSYNALTRLKRLSLQITTTSFRQLIPFLMMMRNLECLELTFSGEANEIEAVLSDAFNDYDEVSEEDPDYASALPKLRSLKLEYPDISRTVLGLAELFAPTLKSLELHLKDYAPEFQPARPEEPIGFVKAFPVLTDLTLSGDINALLGARASISDDLFPSLKHLRYLPNVFWALCARRQGEPEITPSVRKNTIDRITAYNLVGPAHQSNPRTNWRMNSFVTAPPLYPHLLTHVAEPEFSKPPSRVRDLRKTLRFLIEWENRATVQSDTASLLRMSSALTRVELERIAHEA